MKNNFLDHEIAIIVIAYNRPNETKRLINSILNANYSNDKVDLYISIDKGQEQKKILDIAESIYWKNGNKIIRIYEERLGLKKHVLNCGDLTKDYKAIIVLEDDLIVSPSFYKFAKESLMFYGCNSKIAGISLYSHKTNLAVNRFFEPAYNGSDVYMLQYAQSWGQCWTRDMWNLFRNWYNENTQSVFDNKFIPNNVISWDDKSWLKYFIKYVIDNDKYFVYPYFSFSTNFSDVGSHSKLSINHYQVQLVDGDFDFRFKCFEDCFKYDAFFERLDIIESIQIIEGKSICLDLYGSRSFYQNKQLLFTTRKLSYFLIKEIDLKLRPHEMNCINQFVGNGIFVYDLNRKITKTFSLPISYKTIEYDIKSLNWKRTLIHGILGLLNVIKNSYEHRRKY